jgi:sugar lactone lactonase YvrE
MTNDVGLRMRHNPYVAYNRTVLLLACAPLFAQQYKIATISGNGVAGGYFSNPTSVAVDQRGDVYVADWSGYIRKIWVRDGATTVFAGTGILGYSGDGGQATNAMIGKAISIALDSEGNVYFADSNNNRIRRVDISSRIITTVAGTGAATDSGDGGLAVNAGVSQPTGISIDAADDLYFSSSWSRIRKVRVSTGMIGTVAGQSVTSFGGDNGPALDALFWDPIPSAVDRNGNLFIADYENSRVRMVTIATGLVTTVAGSSACATGAPLLNGSVCQGGFSGDDGPARNATLNHVQSVALDHSGNLYIADTLNHRIRWVDASSGSIYTIAGNGENGFSGDEGPALTAEISFPVSVAIDQSGRVYFADENNNRIRALTPVASQFQFFRQRPLR